MNSPFANKLLNWYSSQERDLPWRKKPLPYSVWVAEIMAQQTRLASMLPYYRRWMKRFPTIKSLARSKEQDVLKLWEGLGYYSRARNLRKAAKIVAKEYRGRLPASASELRNLPGIGAYTAGAIASIAFGFDEAAVDGNAIRVLARYFDVQLNPASAEGKEKFQELATKQLPQGKASTYNQALMDLGATTCVPRNPKCPNCPLRESCRANSLGIQDQRPMKTKSSEIPLRHFAAAVVRREGKVLVLKRRENGLLAGMWEFPNSLLPSAKAAKQVLRRALNKELGLSLTVKQKLAMYEHAYSHFTAQLQVYDCPMNGSRFTINSNRVIRWMCPRDLRTVPMGKLDRSIANSLLVTD